MMSENKSDDNLLIDLDFSSGSNAETSQSDLAAVKNNVNTVHANSNKTSDSLSIFTSSVPIYTLLNSNHANDGIDLSENNPFDKMDIQAGLLDDPFEILANTAMSNTVRPGTPVVKMGTLIAFDTPESDSNMSVDDQHISISSDDDQAESNKNHTSHEKSTNFIINNESVQNEQTLLNLSTSPANADCTRKKTLNSDTPTSSLSARSTGSKKSNSLNLLKYSLSNSRNDSSPTLNVGLDESTSTEEQSRKSILRQSSVDESFDDLSATKPNWIDSETDIEMDSDIDSDIEKLNIPMLSVDVNECNSRENTIVNDDVKKTVGDADKNESTTLNREKLLEKLASIKMKIPSPPTVSVVSTTITNDLVSMEVEPHTPKNQISSIPEKLRMEMNENQTATSDSPNILIEHLKKIVEQCDNKHKQKEARDLLQSLSTILTLENKPNNQDRVKRLEMTPPQTIVRQGTFSIEKRQRNEEEEEEEQEEDEKREMLESDGSNLSETQSDPPKSMDSALSQVIKDLQHVLGGNQNINVLQTHLSSKSQSKESDGMATINPTYIVVMAPPADLPPINGTPRSYRSQSLTTRDKPLAAMRAAQLKLEQQHQQQNKSNTSQAAVRRPSLVRRSSFGAIPLNSSSGQTEKTLQMPSTAPMRRRSLQGMPTANNSNLRPPSPRNKSLNTSATSLTSTSSPSLQVPSITVRRKSLNMAVKDSPQKMKTSYGIIKKPPAPPVSRNLKIRVKETLAGGRSTAPLRANVPLSRVAPLMMINESVSPISDIKRKGLITSTPRTLSSAKLTPGSPAVKAMKGLPQACSTPAITVSTPSKQNQGDVTYLSATPNIKKASPVNAISSTTTTTSTTINRRRSLSDYRTSNVNNKDINPGSNAVKLNNIKTGLIGLKKLLPEKLTKIGLQKTQSTNGIISRNKENKIPK